MRVAMAKIKISVVFINIALFASIIWNLTQPTFAAALTGTIAVIDLQLEMPLASVDDLDTKAAGTIKIFQKHSSPLTSKGELNLARIKTGPVTLTQRIEIMRRGASSLGHAKKNYSLDLKGQASSILGMPADKEWVMHSCWADKTCLRNVIGYWQANKLFSGSPRTEFAEVFINNDYRGLYVITEKIKLGISRLNLPEVDKKNITGTYIFKREAADTDWDWASTNEMSTFWWLVQPKRKDTTLTQLVYIKNFMNNTVEPMFNPISPTYKPANYSATINENAAIDFMIIQEMANSVDAYWKSMFVTKKRDDHLYMGPIWDLDLAFANANISLETCQTEGWRIETSEASGRTPFQPLKEIWAVPNFRTAFKKRWYDLRIKKIISSVEINKQLYTLSHRINQARIRDNKKWHTIGQPTWWECTIKPTYGAEVTELKRWINTRISWMDKALLNRTIDF